ncbi:MAG: hypothetical protein K0V04_40755 [Deltaproteobacteria bacterium]|nr:hypothetical protein [Deltaproteobacteria bacterium]
MSRIARHTAVLALSCGLGCQTQRSKLERLVPDDALGMVSFDLEALTSTVPGFAYGLVDFLDNPKVLGALTEARQRCGVDYRTWSMAVVGVRAAPTSMVFALRGPKLGRRATLECLAQAGGAAFGLPAAFFELTDDDGLPLLKLADGQMLAWGAETNTLVITGAAWKDSIRERIGGKGRPAVEGRLREAVAAVHPEAAAWVAFDFSSQPGPVEGTPFEGATRASGTARFHGEMTFEGQAEFSSAASALAATTALRDDLAATMGDARKLPAEVREAVTFATAGTTVTVAVRLPLSTFLD